MELMKQQYYDTINMPVKVFYDLLKWKSELEEERRKVLKEQEQDLLRQRKNQK